MSQDRDTCGNQASGGRGECCPTLDFDSLGATFLKNSAATIEEVGKIVVREGEGHVGNEEGFGPSPGDGSGMVHHHVKRDRDGRFEAELGGADRVTDENHVHPSGIGILCGGGIISGDGDDRPLGFER